MLTVLLLQNGECHINSYKLSNGNYRTVCSKTVDKQSHVNTLSADDTFPGTCPTCRRYYDEMYQDDLDSKAAMARSMSNINLKSTLDHHRANIAGPEADYSEIEDRGWWRLTKYQRLIPKGKQKKRKLNKYKFFK